MITCHELTTDFLIFATDMGHIVYFHIEEWSKAMEYKHIIGITKIHTDPAGTRLVFLDSKAKGYLFNGVCINYFVTFLKFLSMLRIFF